MTKAEIVQALYTRVGGFSRKESAELVDLVFEMMKETLGKGEKIKISGFGNFVLRDKRQRPGRNPQTGDPIKISERRVLTFKASQILKQALNPKNGSNAGATPKLYFRIGEVASLVGVEPHVLRYWEREFRSIRPSKSAKGQRVYSRRDVENLLRVRELLYAEGFTIAGAKKKLVRGGIEAPAPN